MRALLTAAAATMAFAAAASPASAQILRDAEIEAMLREYTTPFLEVAGLEPLATDIYLVGDPSINAFVTNGQSLFINTGTLLEANSPNQIKGVIAHEVGHIAAGHLSRSRRAQTAAMGTMLATMGLGLLAAMSGAPDAGMAVMAGSSQMGYASMARHTFVQEGAADQAGIAYLEATGQSGRGLLQFFDKLRQYEVLRDRDTGSFYGDFMRDHPTSAQRIATLRDAVEASEYRDVQDSEEDVLQLRMIQAKTYGYLEPTSRVLRRYPVSDTSRPARYARAFAYFRNGGLDLSLAEVNSLIAEAPENPYFWELKGQMYFESGRPEESVEAYREAVRLAPGVGLFQTALGQSLAAIGQPATDLEAEEALKAGLALEPELGTAWYYLSQIYSRAGDQPRAQLATAEQRYHLGDYIAAREFASRAQNGLERNGSEWRRATDILAVSESLAREQAEAMRRNLVSN